MMNIDFNDYLFFLVNYVKKQNGEKLIIFKFKDRRSNLENFLAFEIDYQNKLNRYLSTSNIWDIYMFFNFRGQEGYFEESCQLFLENSEDASEIENNAEQLTKNTVNSLTQENAKPDVISKGNLITNISSNYQNINVSDQNYETDFQINSSNNLIKNLEDLLGNNLFNQNTNNSLNTSNLNYNNNNNNISSSKITPAVLPNKEINNNNNLVSKEINNNSNTLVSKEIISSTSKINDSSITKSNNANIINQNNNVNNNTMNLNQEIKVIKSKNSNQNN